MSEPLEKYEVVEKLKEYFNYDPISGIVSWKKKRNRNTVIGSRAGYVWYADKKYTSYIRVGFFGMAIFAHHIAFAIMENRIPDSDIDHVNGNGLDNAWLNINEVSHQDNSKNQKLNTKNNSGEIGIGFHKATQKWRVRVVVNKKEHHAGVFSNFKDAILARNSIYKNFGFHENHGRL